MMFLSVCDASGVAELAVFDATVLHERSQNIRCEQTICAHGVVMQDHMRGVTLEVVHVRMLNQ